MVNFLKIRWKGIQMPKVVKRGAQFILRYKMEDELMAAYDRRIQFFYSKPLILRKWGEGMGTSEKITIVPTWVQLPNLPLGMWGVRSLSKIESKIGTPIQTDELTTQKLKLDYARVLVEVEIGKYLP
ncbi:hypothetical protein BUALT_Bualt02G0138300 [Buddleja alternifolia]|uniref:DUF4283 domain-containing protein n=1 Tax=Buddleja alternifolia TaxID=168488 RepID=A0AAV6Y8L9_9LAMI|nr:hypothetical protein BUALT_Bualt02G0138300 [Buddleja alternifolia]